MSKRKLYTKKNAIERLSNELRRPDIETGPMIKVLSLYIKLMGWDKDKAPSEDRTINQLVAEIERQRKA